MTIYNIFNHFNISPVIIVIQVIMDRILQSLESTLNEIDSLDKSIKGEKMESPQNLSILLNSYISSLNTLSKSGKTMDESAMFNVPIELLELIDQSNHYSPEDYLNTILLNCDESANEIAERIYYLKVT